MDNVIKREVNVLRYGGIEVSLEDIGPKEAKLLLDTYDVDYRKLRPSHLAPIVRDMSQGRWKFNGDTILVDADDNLLDGQHRLTAIVETGTTQVCLVVRGLRTDVYETLDTGLIRTYRDTLRRRGYANVTLRVALIRLIDSWLPNENLMCNNKRTLQELDEINNLFEADIDRAMVNTVSMARKIDMPSRLVAFLWWHITAFDREGIFTFMVSVAEGENLKRGDPAWTLRDRLRTERESDLNLMEYMDLFLQAFCAFQKGESKTRLYVHRDVSSKQFPTILPRNAAN